uniref:exo-alpha-sialidase n=1 Tax=Sphenodon punctatus TaxID=8508 RepID=A0A8D0HGJ6_SPHPU
MAEALLLSEKVTLFRQEAPGGITYRIPALLYLPKETTFLAFAEKRSSAKDTDAEYLVLRRGRKDGASVQWEPLEALSSATLPGHRTMNPCPVYEAETGTIFLFFICVERHVTEGHQILTGRNAARLCYVSTGDAGRTWSPLVDLTEQVIGEDVRNWATFAVGPGHGVQLSSGRLVIPAYTYYIHMHCCGQPVPCCTKPHALTFYSDDRGRSWCKGHLLKARRAAECEVAEVTRQDGRKVLYCSARTPDKCRVEALSTDGGDRFQESSLCRELCEPPHGCQGSVVSFTPAPGQPEPDWKDGPKSWLIYSHPTSRHKRVNLGIYLNPSPLEQACWTAPWVLYKGPSGYSDLAVCAGGTPRLFGCLFECGVACECEEIAFRLFSYAELLRGIQDDCAQRISDMVKVTC